MSSKNNRGKGAKSAYAQVSDKSGLEDYAQEMESYLQSIGADDRGRGNGAGNSTAAREESPEFRWMDLKEVRRRYGDAVAEGSASKGKTPSPKTAQSKSNSKSPSPAKVEKQSPGKKSAQKH